MSKICEMCGKEHDGSYGSGRFCSRACANTRRRSAETREKVSNSLKNYFIALENTDRVCEKCGKIYHSKDNTRKLCFDCLPTIIKYIKTEKQVNSILDLSKRTVEKVLHRLDLPCTCCGAYVKGVVWDVHHITPKKFGGTDDMNNLTYICPNCHRIAHTDINLLSNKLVSLEEYFLQIMLIGNPFTM